MKSELFWKILYKMAKSRFILNTYVNLSRIPKEYLEKRDNGVYLNLTSFVFSEPNEWGKDVAVALKKPKDDESETLFLGGGWLTDLEKKRREAQESTFDAPPATRKPSEVELADDDLPF